MFPTDEQSSIRIMLSESLRGVISQRLVPNIDNTKRIPILEVMFSSTAVGNMIRERKVFQIPNLLKISKDKGNTNFEDYALTAYEEGRIDEAVLKSFRTV
jgi:twitching motility protein PilT